MKTHENNLEGGGDDRIVFPLENREECDNRHTRKQSGEAEIKE